MRQAGYHNYIDREELLLCDVAAKFVPIGWNMWESVAAEYNASKERSWAARDFDWLRRKFRKLYAKPKPTDYRVQSGAHTSHDGRVNGVDDTQLLEEVNSALNGEGGLIQLAQAGLGPIQSGDQNLGEQNDDDVSDASPDENFDIINSSYVGGRLRVRISTPIVSVATPDGSALSRNPDRAATDAVEAERFRRMNATSDWLGGRDLRVLRDNFEEMGVNPGAKSKRPATETTAPPTYVASKRVRAKKRMEALEKGLREAELASAATG
ncbi:hypothetical protein PR003_g16487 [Phytophthora rubi]|uniref:DUF6818 domain-containing protein n=1 Tax=Phytophthora rubi TaxID=129364 RepID=A0A6A4EP93_9STRA|nr:hypothetical protein PR003_g16487 [Phytophthora rubi]